VGAEEVYDYQLTHDSSSGAPLPGSALIAGNHQATDHEHRFGMKRTFTTNGDTVQVQLRYRATASSSIWSSASIRVLDSDDDVVHEFDIVAGGTTDTGWQQYVTPVLSLFGSTSVTVLLYLRDNTASDQAQILRVDDVRVVSNAAPTAPTALAQLQADGTTSIPVGGICSSLSPVFRGAVTDPDLGQPVALEIEARPIGTAFTGVPNHGGDGLDSSGLREARGAMAGGLFSGAVNLDGVNDVIMTPNVGGAGHSTTLEIWF
jgi:hypothetical protein